MRQQGEEGGSLINKVLMRPQSCVMGPATLCAFNNFAFSIPSPFFLSQVKKMFHFQTSWNP